MNLKKIPQMQKKILFAALWIFALILGGVTGVISLKKNIRPSSSHLVNVQPAQRVLPILREIEPNEMERIFFSRWMAADDVKIYLASMPESSDWQSLAQIRFIFSQWQWGGSCLYAKGFSQNKKKAKGELAIFTFKIKTLDAATHFCPDQLLFEKYLTKQKVKEGSEILLLKNLFDSKMQLDWQSRSLHLNFIFAKKQQQIIWNGLFPLYNLYSEDSANLPMDSSRAKTKYSSSVPLTRLPGMRVLAFKEVNLEGNKTDYFPILESGKKCHEVNDLCESVTPFACERCRFGYYEVVSSDCSEGGDKYCGTNHCGARGQPACPRGRYWRQLQDKACSTESFAGFCADGLSTFCNDEGVLVCQ